MSIFSNVKVSEQSTTKEGMLAFYDCTVDSVVCLTESTTVPVVFSEGRSLLQMMLDAEPDVGDFVMFIKGLYEECQRRGCYPASLDADVGFAKHKKNDDGSPGSTSDRPHYRELSQAAKNTGRIVFLAQLKHALSKLYVAACRYLGEEHPENLPFNDRLLEANYPNWQTLLSYVK
jgi:hypothetical protein